MEISVIKENWINTMNTDVSASIASWDCVASGYVYDHMDCLRDDPFLTYVQEKIPFHKEMAVLDVGCGAGAYSVALADKVKAVDATDFSPKMLEAGKTYVEEHQISNIRFLERDWWNCDGEEFRGKYDFVFAHTTPAIADYHSFLKMMEASKGYCALCKPARRTDKIWDQLVHLAGVSNRKSDDSIAYAFDTIWAMGGNPEIAYHETVWKSAREVEKAKIWYVNRLKSMCDMDQETENRVCRYLEQISEDGVVKETTNTTLVTMVWKVTK